jgi:hypothetical protein
MCRVNPYKVRISSIKNDYWIVNPEGKNHCDEIRAYRILIKEKEK